MEASAGATRVERANSRTITNAIQHVMVAAGHPLSAEEAYKSIVAAGLYQFHADNPSHVVRTQIRRHCEGLDFPSAARVKYFRLVGDGRYEPLPKTINASRPRKRGTQVSSPTPSIGKLGNVGAKPLEQLQLLHKKYESELKARMLGELKKLSPAGFENFAKRLLDVYGFHDTRVTQVNGDGGIDGFGKLKVGLANLNVAFQCKRWTKGNIQRPEIDKFRGAAQGDVEQGLFFTTSTFSDGAIQASIKRGAVPIILVDGPAIVDMMIEKRLGVQVETISIPILALDLALDPEDGSHISARRRA